MIDLSVDIAGIKMQNPIMPASGTFGYGEEFSDLIDVSKLGAVVTKGTTVQPRPGNEQPRIAETRAGMINSIGLQNPGAEIVAREKIPFLRQFKVPIIVNISGTVPEDYLRLVAIFNEVEGVAGLEVNISCPNVKQGGILFGQHPTVAHGLISQLKKISRLSLIVKLTPNVTDIVTLARAVVEAGADALSLVNTFTARAKIRSGHNKGKWIEGGLSGPGIMSMALRKVSDVYKASLGVPIIGIGGIQFIEDVVDFLESGADAVQIGTANFVNPLVMMELVKELGLYIEKTGCQSLKEWREKGFPMPS
jgi:dihydroorotate dehydrogenase (NAD+) catalytic subunit